MDFVPFEYVGIFKLDDDVNNYLDELSQYVHLEKDEHGFEYYHISEPYSEKDNLFLSVTDGKIRTVFCYDSAIFNGIELIGLTVDEFKNITNSDYIGEPDELDIFEDKPPLYDYSFKEIGITVTTHYGKIQSLTISGHWVYEED